ncbi:MAG: hypothetical protein PUK21_04000, partial [Peptostreptococcaceae bacterium]|nr:hypothetical protein [Peptostreptococcaceae bacterium]
MIRKNNRVNKIISMLTAVIMFFGIFVTMLQQAETVYAGSENVSLNINANPSGGYRVNGHSSLSSNYT